jgi:hypothetical protein
MALDIAADISPSEYFLTSTSPLLALFNLDLSLQWCNSIEVASKASADAKIFHMCALTLAAAAVKAPIVRKFI